MKIPTTSARLGTPPASALIQAALSCALDCTRQDDAEQAQAATALALGLMSKAVSLRDLTAACQPLAFRPWAALGAVLDEAGVAPHAVIAIDPLRPPADRASHIGLQVWVTPEEFERLGGEEMAREGEIARKTIGQALLPVHLCCCSRP